MKKVLLCLCLGLSLGACSSPHLQPVCPTLVTYSKVDQQTLATELRQTPEHTQTIRWISDYIGLRDQVRECQKNKGRQPEFGQPSRVFPARAGMDRG
ncbi:hypothetical protein [Aristophania vespae]|uniref:hypothetical protein n=1 Tax=Aristophania vespae TaxID=2697033 RepID=UPI002351B77D|nr:hypothetical protein [Aristophania vespae]UMM63084.1 hypothetical protein DM15PD_00380 [Aristophania vespae]